MRKLIKSCRELEQDLVPEWRAKYLDYKVIPTLLSITIHALMFLSPRRARRRSRLLQGLCAMSIRHPKLLDVGGQPIFSPPRPSSYRYRIDLHLTAPFSELVPTRNKVLLKVEGVGWGMERWRQEPPEGGVVRLTTMKIRRL